MAFMANLQVLHHKTELDQKFDTIPSENVPQRRVQTADSQVCARPFQVLVQQQAQAEEGAVDDGYLGKIELNRRTRLGRFAENPSQRRDRGVNAAPPDPDERPRRIMADFTASGASLFEFRRI